MKFLMILFHYASMLVELKTALFKYNRKLGQNKYYLQASGYYRNNMQAYQWLFFYTNGMVATSQTKISKIQTF